MSTRNQERRRSQRVQAKLKMEARLPVADGQLQVTNLETLNISSSGVYFRSDHFIEPMTKLDMSMELPIAEDAETGKHEYANVKCQGIIVRVVPEQEAADCDQYEVAVFFTGIDPASMARLEEHVALMISLV